MIEKCAVFGKNCRFQKKKTADFGKVQISKTTKSAKSPKTTKSVDFSSFCSFPGQNPRISM